MARPTKYHELEDQFAQVIDDLELYSYYQLLEVDPAASGDVVLYTFNMKVYEYEQLQKDRWCGPVLHRNLELLKKRLDEAREVLCDRKLRVQYDRGLEEGQTRHPEVAARRDSAGRPPSRPTGPLTVVEQLAAKLERTIHKDLIHAEEEIPDVISEGIDEELVDQVTIDLRDQVDKLGVELTVKEEEPAEQATPIEAEFLDKASQHLVGRLIVEHDLTLHEQTEADDQSADAAFASEITDGLRGELYKMGVSEWDAHEADALPPDLETLDRLLAAEQGAVEKLGVKTAVERDEGLHARDVDRATAARMVSELEGKLGQTGIRTGAEKAERSLSASIGDQPELAAARPAGITATLPSARPSSGPAPILPTYFQPIDELGAPEIVPVPFEEVISIDEAPRIAPPQALPSSVPPPSAAPVSNATGPHQVLPRSSAPTGPHQVLPRSPAPGNATGPHPVLPSASDPAASEDPVPIIPFEDDP